MRIIAIETFAKGANFVKKGTEADIPNNIAIALIRSGLAKAVVQQKEPEPQEGGPLEEQGQQAEDSLTEQGQQAEEPLDEPEPQEEQEPPKKKAGKK